MSLNVQNKSPVDVFLVSVFRKSVVANIPDHTCWERRGGHSGKPQRAAHQQDKHAQVQEESPTNPAAQKYEIACLLPCACAPALIRNLRMQRPNHICTCRQAWITTWTTSMTSTLEASHEATRPCECVLENTFAQTLPILWKRDCAWLKETMHPNQTVLAKARIQTLICLMLHNLCRYQHINQSYGMRLSPSPTSRKT